MGSPIACADSYRLDAVRAHLLEMAGERDAAIASYRLAAGSDDQPPGTALPCHAGGSAQGRRSGGTEEITADRPLVRPLPSRAMLAPPAPGESRRRQARDRLAMQDDFGIALVLILITIIVFASAQGAWGQFVSVALSGGTLLFVLHTAGAHRRTFRAAAVVVVIAVLGAGHRGPVRRRGRDHHGRGRRPAAGGRRTDRHPAPDRPKPDHHRPADPRRALDLPLARAGLRLSLSAGRDTHPRPVLRADDDAQRLRLHLFQLHDAGHDRVRRLHGGVQPRVGWSRCPRVSSGSCTSSRPWRCSSATSDASCGGTSSTDCRFPADRAWSDAVFGT